MVAPRTIRPTASRVGVADHVEAQRRCGARDQADRDFHEQQDRDERRGQSDADGEDEREHLAHRREKRRVDIAGADRQALVRRVQRAQQQVMSADAEPREDREQAVERGQHAVSCAALRVDRRGVGEPDLLAAQVTGQFSAGDQRARGEAERKSNRNLAEDRDDNADVRARWRDSRTAPAQARGAPSARCAPAPAPAARRIRAPSSSARRAARAGCRASRSA